MNTFAISSSLLNSKLVNRAGTTEDHNWEIGLKKGKASSNQYPVIKNRFSRKYQRSPDRNRSWQRKRRIGSKSISMPPEISELFTEGERAALNILANVVKENSICEWPIDKIAAIAGVCRRTVQNAISSAKAAGLITVQIRPVRGRKNLTNLIRIVSKSWKSWLRRSASSFRLAIGCKTLHPTGEIFSSISKANAEIATSVPLATSRDGLMRGKKPDD